MRFMTYNILFEYTYRLSILELFLSFIIISSFIKRSLDIDRIHW